MRKKCLPILILSAALLMSACQLIPVEESLPPVPVIHSYEQEEYQLATTMRGDMSLELTIRCSYDLARLEKLSFDADYATFEAVYVQQGQTVKAGDLLATLDRQSLLSQLEYQQERRDDYLRNKRHLQEMLNLELDNCNALIKQLEQELAQLQEGDAAVAAIEQQIAALQRRCEQAQKNYTSSVRPIDENLTIVNLQIESIEQELSKLYLYAGIDGMVTYLRDVEPGQYFDASKQFITIADVESAIFTTDVEYAEYLPIGAAVTLTCKGKELEAHVVDPEQLDLLQTNKEKIYIQLDQPDPSLERNCAGIITVVLDSRTDVLYIDKSAIHTHDGKTFVYLPNDDGMRTMRYVTTGLELRDVVEIVEGLEEGEQAIIG